MKSIETLKNELMNGTHKEILQQLYVDPVKAAAAPERLMKAMDNFAALYGEQEIEIYSAPGRTEVGGNHTDHQNGQVLAASVNLDTVAVVAARNDGKVRLKSEGYRPIELSLDGLEPVASEEGTTHALIRGVAAGLAKRGYAIGGFDAYVISDVLSGSGLSSSAAFEVLVGNVLSGIYNEGNISQVEIAKVSQEAENIFFGKPCGLMDQMASAVGGLVHIDFADPSDPVIDPVSVDFSAFGHNLCIVDTHGSHADLTQDYADIPAEMKAAAHVFGAELLCQVDEKEFYARIGEVRQKAGDRAVLRAIHWFNENRRVEGQAAALRAGDFDAFKKWIKASGDSSFKYLQNVYASHKPAEQAVSLAILISEQLLGEEGVVRVHGGGFAGTIQAFVPVDKTEAYKEGIEAVFGEGSCYVLNIRPVGGTRLI